MEATLAQVDSRLRAQQARPVECSPNHDALLVTGPTPDYSSSASSTAQPNSAAAPKITATTGIGGPP